ncbi:MAG: hypothetical protein HeimC2_32120 [Candidatus Heimdallarchaeota archaeon LC_2]|nr:MAG: hypothetical protein HeimC2_32120 [Candidatus Heimdallarchaeota archaeon LC_2]
MGNKSEDQSKQQLIPQHMKPFFLQTGKFLAKHEECLNEGYSLEINHEYLFCPNCADLNDLTVKKPI